ncbi:MAG: helix-turn-helix transcriptional regulator [Acidobacteriota bacterium]
MTTERVRPIEYWMSLARMGFEDDLHRLLSDQDISQAELADAIDTTPAYISKVLNGSSANFTIRTMAKLAQALDALVQIRLTRDGREVVRTLSVEEARAFDEARARRSADSVGEQTGAQFDFSGRTVNPKPGFGNLVNIQANG